MSLHILIVGVGSVGKRHARNFRALGCKISCIDSNIKRVQELAKEFEIISFFNSIESALLNSEKYSGVVISSPTGFHASALELSASINVPILLEKPVARNLIEATNMLHVSRNKNIRLLLGYTWRWWGPLRKVKELISKGEIGLVRHVQFHMSAHLADWHPWEPYQSFFMASVDQGGGALLDESHWIDLMVWLFGMPEKIIARVEKISDLEIETDDNVDVIAIYAGGLRVTIHLDLYGRPHEKYIRFIGEDGTLVWSAEPNRIGISGKSEQIWEEEIFDCVRNDMFISVAEEFVDVIRGNSSELTCDLMDGLNVMRIIEMIRKSSKEGRIICIGDLD